MTRMVSKASLTNLAGAAAVVLTCGAWGAANGMVQEPPANARPNYDLGTLKKKRGEAPAVDAQVQKGRETGGVNRNRDPQPYLEKHAAGLSAAAPDPGACASGVATACRAIEADLASGQWAWKDGNVTAMDDWETQAARRDPAKMTVKFGPPRATAGAEARATGNHIPSAVIVQRVLAACDGGDVTACAAFAASVEPVMAARDSRSHTAGR